MNNVSQNNQINLVEIPEDQLPEVISKQYDIIVEIDKKIKLSEERCNKAKEIAEQQVQLKVGNNKDAIVSTQNAVKSIVEAQESLSIAQKLLFENQQKMAEGMRFLLLLGSENIAMNRRVVSELEMKLRKASEEELSNAARLELINVIRLLKEQESAFSKQDRMSEQLNKNTEIIEEIIEVDKKQNEKDLEHDNLININTETNKKQDEEIKRQEIEDKKHDKQIKSLKIISLIGLLIALIALLLSVISLMS